MTSPIVHPVMFSAWMLAWQGSVATVSQPSTAVLGPEDVEFARELSSAGYEDLAEGLCRAIAGSPSEAAEHAAARALQLDLRLAHARREKDLSARRQEALAVLADKEAFAREHAGTPEAEATRYSLPDVYQLVAETFALALEREPVPEAAVRLREQGAGILRRAADSTRAQIQDLAGADDLATPAGRQLLSARYSLPRILYFHARLYPADDATRNELLTVAIDHFMELELDYSDTLVCYEGRIFSALCYRDLGRPDAALEQLDGAIALREQYSRRGKTGGWILPAEALDVVSAAVTQKLLVLRESRQDAAMAAAVDDFARTIENAWDAPRAAGVLALLGDAQLARSDTDGVRQTIQRLREVARRQSNPQAEWKARDLDAALVDPTRGSASDPAAILRAAQLRFGQGATDAALHLCRAVVTAVRGTPLVDTVGANAWMLMAALHGQRGLLHEASVAYEALLQECPSAELAPEALWRAAACYLEINAREPNRFYTRRAQARIGLLVTRYPDSEPAQKAALLRGRQLEAEKEYGRARADYLRVPEGAAGYEEARCRAGTCLVREVLGLLQEGRPNEAAAKARLAEHELRDTIRLMEQRAGQTLDTRVQDSMAAMAFGARVWLADLFLAKGIDRPAEVAGLFAALDERALGADAARASVVWRLRIQSLVDQDRLDDAVAHYHSARLQTGPGSLREAARILARALDTRAVRLGATGSPGEVDETWRRAAALYRDSVTEDDTSAEELEAVGTRLLVIGLHLARVPEDRSTFVGWNTPVPDPERHLDQAIRLLAAAAAGSPLGTTLLKLAQAQAWLGRHGDAASSYGRLFDGQGFVDEARGRIDREVLAARPELLMAWLEWGACEHRMARADNDDARYARCLRICQAVIDSMASDSLAWWTAKHELITALVDRGEYETADVVHRDVLRTQDPAVMARHGFGAAFDQLGRVLKEKVMR